MTGNGDQDGKQILEPRSDPHRSFNLRAVRRAGCVQGDQGADAQQGLGQGVESSRTDVVTFDLFDKVPITEREPAETFFDRHHHASSSLRGQGALSTVTTIPYASASAAITLYG